MTTPRRGRHPIGTGSRLTTGLRELVVLASLWVVYSASRLLASHDLPSARHHGADILGVERYLHLDIESGLNHAVGPAMQIAVPMSFWYASLHYLVTPAVLAFLYFYRPAEYPRARNALLIATAIGLLAYILIPTAPPRLMPGSHYVDVLSETARYGWWTSHASAPAGLGQLTNELAAMPSLHVGWTVWVAWAAWRHVRPIARTVSCLYVLGTTFVVITTGNHWLLDAVAGAGTAAAGIVLASRVDAYKRQAKALEREGITTRRHPHGPPHVRPSQELRVPDKARARGTRDEHSDQLLITCDR